MSPYTFVTLLLLAVTVGMGQLLVRKFIAQDAPQFVQALGFRQGPRGTARAWIFAFLLTIAYAVFTVIGVPGVGTHALEFSLIKCCALLAAVAAGVVEECFFRRYLMDRLARAAYSRVWQIAISGISFGGAHAVWGLLANDPQTALGAMIATTILGWGLAAVYIIGKESLAPCIVAHTLIDAIIEPGLLLAAFSRHAV